MHLLTAVKLFLNVANFVVRKVYICHETKAKELLAFNTAAHRDLFLPLENIKQL